MSRTAAVSDVLKSDLLEKAMVAARDLPADMQGDLMRLVLAYADSEPSVFWPAEDEAGAPETRDVPR